MPEFDHSGWQGALILFFNANGKTWGVRSRSELRVQVAPTRFRVPDITALSRTAPLEQIIVTPRLAVFEILSPEDRWSAVMEKFADYKRMDVAGIWIIDPRKSVETAIGYGYRSGNLESISSFDLPGLGVTFTEQEIVAFID